MKVAVIQFPGSNCERETLLALKRVGLPAEAILWNEDAKKLATFSAYILVGGFSYEDRVRSGLLASMDPLMQVLKKEATSGKAILGLCNGAQILVESGLVPGLPNQEVAMALTHNKRIKQGKLVGTGFYNTWIHIKASHNNPHNAFVSAALVSQPMHIPAAHAEGRFLLEPQLYQALQQTDAIFYYYCDHEGKTSTEFPITPNGAAFGLAGVSNAQGNILALMPHPERTPAGDPLFMALKDYLQRWQQHGEKPLSSATLTYQAPQLICEPYKLETTALHYWVGLNIHDNVALSLESNLQRQGIPVKLKRFTHWQISGAQNKDQAHAKIIESDFIFNRQKEYTLDLAQIQKKGKKILLVRPLEDELALHKQNLLQHELKLKDVTQVLREEVWAIDCEDQNLEEISALLMNKPILANPLAHKMFYL